MREPNYQEAISHSWQMVKEHKILWIFGLLSACLGQWGVANFLGGLNLAGLNELTPDAGWQAAGKFLMIIAGSGTTPALLVLWLALIALALLILAVFVAVVSRGALIAAVGHWFAKGGKISSTLVWHHGVRNFWKILFLSILTRATEAAILFFAMAVFILCGNSSAGFVAQAFFGALFLAAGLIVEAVMIFASGYAVIDGATVPAAIARGWRLFSRHVLITLEIGLALGLLSLLLALLVPLVGFLVFIPVFFIWMLALAVGSELLIALGTILAIILFLIVVIISASIFNAFNTSVWMYLFIKMHRENYGGWLIQKIKKLFSR